MNFRGFIREFIGAFALIFAGVGVIGVNHMTGGVTGPAGVGLAHGLTIALMTLVRSVVGSSATSARIYAMKHLTLILSIVCGKTFPGDPVENPGQKIKNNTEQ